MLSMPGGELAGCTNWAGRGDEQEEDAQCVGAGRFPRPVCWCWSFIDVVRGPDIAALPRHAAVGRGTWFPLPNEFPALDEAEEELVWEQGERGTRPRPLPTAERRNGGAGERRNGGTGEVWEGEGVLFRRRNGGGFESSADGGTGGDRAGGHRVQSHRRGREEVLTEH